MYAPHRVLLGFLLPVPDEPSNWELARGLKEIKDTLQGVMTVALWQAYQQGLDQRLTDLAREQANSVVRHNSDVDRLQAKIDEHAKQSALDKKAAADRAASQRAAIAVTFLAALLPTVIGLLRVGGA